jgi:TetR/AcrR family tetracycline transcriptional repressor
MPRPQRVTREMVLDAAMQLVQEEGVQALTMRRLGDRLSTDPAMIYRLFRNKSDLLEALADSVFTRPGDTTTPGGDASAVGAPTDWQRALHQMAHGIRAALLSHPNLIGVAVRRPPRGEATYRGIDTALGVLLTAGLTPKDAAQAYQAVLFYALGFAVLEQPFASSPDGGVAQQGDTHRVLAALPAQAYPNIAAAIDHLYGPDLEAQFDYGLQLLIAGIADRHRPLESAPEGSGG